MSEPDAPRVAPQSISAPRVTLRPASAPQGISAPRGSVPRLTSPVLSMLGGVTPEGMVCGIDGVCSPIGKAQGEPTALDTDESSPTA